MTAVTATVPTVVEKQGNMTGKWKCGHCTQTSSRHWNMRVHIQRKHNGLGVPLLLDTQTFHETVGYAVHPMDSMESPLNHFRDIDPKAHFAVSKPLEAMYANLMKIEKTKQMIQRFESLYTKIFNPVTSNSLGYQTFTTQSTSPPSGTSRHQSSLAWNLGINVNTPEYYDSNLDPLRDMIFGFKGYACNTCVSCGIIPVYFSVELGNQFSNGHECNNAINLPSSSRKMFMQYLRKRLPNDVTNEYIKWSGGSLSLTSKKIERAPKNLIGNSFCIPNGHGENHWLLRAILRSPTALEPKELLEFICLSESNNNNLFEIHSSGRQELNGDYGLLLVKN